MEHSFGNWIKHRRKALDLTQHELAERVGCSVSLIFKIEADERRPSRQIAELLANHLEIAPEQRSLFLKVARQEKSIEHLESITREVAQGFDLDAAPQSNPAPASGPFKSELPTPLTSLIGREHELSMVLRQLQNPACRLLTLTGPGGVGKTSLALEVAHRLRDSFSHGAGFVSLASTNRPEFILTTVAEALGFVFLGAAEPKMQLFNFLKEKDILLVLDNLEHLLEGIEVLSELLEFAPDVRILATSREQLNLRTEWVFEVQGLPVPSDMESEHAESNSAVALFIQRVKQTKRNFVPTSADLGPIIRICQLVEGLPLGIELAAAWMRVMSVSEIATEIEQDIDFLTTNARDMPTRHRSIRAVFDHSWGLLSAEEQSVLMRLSVFRGGFTLRAAEAVAEASLETLARLMDKSLLYRAETGRYNLHELVRQYAEMHLCQIPAEEEATHQRHSHYYLSLLSASGRGLQSNSQKKTLDQLMAEIDNVRLAWAWAISHHQIEELRNTSSPLLYFYELRNVQEGEAMFHKASDMARALVENEKREQAVPKAAFGVLLSHHAYFMARLGNNEMASKYLEEAIRLLQESGDEAGLADALSYKGMIQWFTGQFEPALDDFRQSLELNRKLERTWYIAVNTHSIGTLLHELGRLQEAFSHLKNGLALCRATGDPCLIANAINYLSRMLQELGLYTDAESLLQEGLTLAQASGSHYAVGSSLERMALVAQATGKPEEAHRLFLDSLTLFTDVGDLWSRSRLLNHLGWFYLEQEDLAEAEHSFRYALQIALMSEFATQALDALAGLAMLLARRGAHEMALKVALHVLLHPATAEEAKGKAEKLLIELETQLSHHQVEVARSSLESIPLDVIAREVLVR